MRFCPFAHRIHLVLNAKNISYHVAYINLTSKPEWLVQVSPLTKVPALKIAGESEPIIESLIIADYLDEKYPQNTLYSRDPLQKAADRILIQRFDGVTSPFFRLLYQRNESTAADAVTELLNALDIYEKELERRDKKFFGGSKPGMVDYMIWPWCERLESLKFITKFELDKFRFPKFLKWKDEMQKDQAVKMHYVSPEDHFKFASSMITDSPDYDFLA
ncbi:pyrimidodiazepine synthase-like isoform X2 [Chironomus tepperi]